MAISPELQAQILRYYHVEKWRAGTIARQLASTATPFASPWRVAGWLPTDRQAAPARSIPICRSSSRPCRLSDPDSRRLYGMVYERGYRGHADHFRHMIARHRPRPKAEAYLRLRTFPANRPRSTGVISAPPDRPRPTALMAFVMVLSSSRQIYLRFFLDARMESFLAGHVEAFEAWAGVPGPPL